MLACFLVLTLKGPVPYVDFLENNDPQAGKSL